jgi:DNA-binding winged helix-turn-helix (wHTH) protein
VQFLFADHVLDVARRELRCGSEPVALEPQVFDLLVYLVQNRERVVSKDDLIASVWGGRSVSDSTLTSRINAARKAIGDNGKSQKLIRTIARKGLRFVGDVQTRWNKASGAQLAQVGGCRREVDGRLISGHPLVTGRYCFTPSAQRVRLVD